MYEGLQRKAQQLRRRPGVIPLDAQQAGRRLSGILYDYEPTYPPTCDSPAADTLLVAKPRHVSAAYPCLRLRRYLLHLVVQRARNGRL